MSNSGWTYDAAGNLTNDGTTTYGYPAGNRTSATVNGTVVLSATYNAANEVNGWSYAAAGSLTNDGIGCVEHER